MQDYFCREDWLICVLEWSGSALHKSNCTGQAQTQVEEGMYPSGAI